MYNSSFFQILVIIALVVQIPIESFGQRASYARLKYKKELAIAESVSQKEFSKEMESLIKRTEELLSLRAKSIAFMNMYQGKNDVSGTLLPGDIINLLKGAERYLELRNELIENTNKFSIYLKSEPGKSRDENVWRDKNTLQKKKILLGVVSALVLYDNYFSLVNVYERDEKLRELINKGDGNNIPPNMLNKISHNARKWSYRARLAKVVKSFDKYFDGFFAEEAKEDKEMNYLIELVKGSPVTAVFRMGRFDRVRFFTGYRLSGIDYRIKDYVSADVRKYMNSLSKAFGNTVGMVESRKGHLYHKPNVTKKITGQLKPLDVLLEKTPFRLTDKFIPGHWGHVAIWIGSMDQLVESGLWELVEQTDTWKNINLKENREDMINTLRLDPNNSVWEELGSPLLELEDKSEVEVKNLVEQQEKSRLNILSELKATLDAKSAMMNTSLWDVIEKTEAWEKIIERKDNKQSRIKSRLRNDGVILEALRTGVELNSLKHFLNVDDFLAVRPTYLEGDMEKQAEFIADALTHFGKDYDFNFDVTDIDKIVCSELAYWTFQDILWVTEKVAGRDSISPDNVLSRVLDLNEDKTFTPVSLYHDGAFVENSPQNKKQAYRRELCTLAQYSTLEALNQSISTEDLCAEAL